MPFKINNYQSIDYYHFDFNILKQQILNCSNPIIHNLIDKWIEVLKFSEAIDKYKLKKINNFDYYFNNEIYLLQGNVFNTNYCIQFDIHYILTNIKNINYNITTINKNNDKLISASNIEYNSYFRVKKDNILILESKFIPNIPYLLIDGNHRYTRFKNTKNSNIQANIIDYNSITKKFFMFVFDYVFFIFICELNSINDSYQNFLDTVIKIEKELDNLIE